MESNSPRLLVSRGGAMDVAEPIRQRTVLVAEDIIDVDAGVRAGGLEVCLPIEHVV